MMSHSRRSTDTNGYKPYTVAMRIEEIVETFLCSPTTRQMRYTIYDSGQWGEKKTKQSEDARTQR